MALSGTEWMDEEGEVAITLVVEGVDDIDNTGKGAEASPSEREGGGVIGDV